MKELYVEFQGKSDYVYFNLYLNSGHIYDVVWSAAEELRGLIWINIVMVMR